MILFLLLGLALVPIFIFVLLALKSDKAGSKKCKTPDIKYFMDCQGNSYMDYGMYSMKLQKPDESPEMFVNINKISYGSKGDMLYGDGFVRLNIETKDPNKNSSYNEIN